MKVSRAPSHRSRRQSNDAPLDELRTLAERTANHLPACDTASITLAGAGEVGTVVFVNDDALALDEAQYEEDSGPSLTTVRVHSMTVLSKIVPGPGRYEGFRRRAARSGVASAISAPIQPGGRLAGALNAYSAEAAAFDGDDVQAALADFAAEAGAVLSAFVDSLAPPSVPGAVRAMISGSSG